jgi:phosphoserine phosphatase
MEGKQDFEEALKIRSKLLAGLVADDCWKKICADLQFMPGALSLSRLIAEHFPGSKTAIVSGGFIPVAEVVRAKLGMDFCFANTLLTDESGRFTGGLCDSLIVTPTRKKEVMLDLAKKHEIPSSNVQIH